MARAHLRQIPTPPVDVQVLFPCFTGAMEPASSHFATHPGGLAWRNLRQRGVQSGLRPRGRQRPVRRVACPFCACFGRWMPPIQAGETNPPRSLLSICLPALGGCGSVSSRLAGNASSPASAIGKRIGLKEMASNTGVRRTKNHELVLLPLTIRHVQITPRGRNHEVDRPVLKVTYRYADAGNYKFGASFAFSER